MQLISSYYSSLWLRIPAIAPPCHLLKVLEYGYTIINPLVLFLDPFSPATHQNCHLFLGLYGDIPSLFHMNCGGFPACTAIISTHNSVQGLGGAYSQVEFSLRVISNSCPLVNVKLFFIRWHWCLLALISPLIFHEGNIRMINCLIIPLLEIQRQKRMKNLKLGDAV